MLATAALLASILLGPEMPVPASATAPARGAPLDVVALENGDFIVLWSSYFTDAQRIDGVSGKPVHPVPTTVTQATDLVHGAALGNRLLVVWSGYSGSGWSLLDRDARVLATRTLSQSSTAIAVTRLGDRFLVTWGRGTDRNIVGAFVDTNGAQSDVPFVIIPRDFSLTSLAVASDGSTALVLASDVRTMTISTAVVSTIGDVTPGATVDAPPVGGSLRAVWDGVAYVAMWATETGVVRNVWLAWIDRRGSPIAPSLNFANGSAVLTAASPGVAVFTTTLDDHHNVFARFAPGGALIGTGAVPLPAASADHDDPIVAAAFNGRDFYVVSGGTLLPIRGAKSDLGITAPPEPVAFTAPPQYVLSATAEDHQSFLCWDEEGASRMARVKNAALTEPRDIPDCRVLIADGDRAVAVAEYGNATFLDEDGNPSPSMAVISRLKLPNSLGVGPTLAAARLPDGNFVVLSMATYDGLQLLGWASVFNRGGSVASGELFADLNLAYQNNPVISGASGIVAWVDDLDRTWLARFDAAPRLAMHAGRQLSNIAESPALAEDGGGHALVLGTASDGYGGVLTPLNLVDLESMSVVRTASSLGWPPGGRVAWTGNEYLYVSSSSNPPSLALGHISRSGEPIDLQYVPLPSQPSVPFVVSGLAGTLLVYSRSAPELGAGDLPRLFVRQVIARRRAVH